MTFHRVSNPIRLGSRPRRSPASGLGPGPSLLGPRNPGPAAPPTSNPGVPTPAPSSLSPWSPDPSSLFPRTPESRPPGSSALGTRRPAPAPPSSDPGIRGPLLLRPRVQESRPSPSPSAPGAPTPAPSSLGPTNSGPARLPQTRESRVPRSSALRPGSQGSQLLRSQTEESGAPAPPPADPGVPARPSSLCPSCPDPSPFSVGLGPSSAHGSHDPFLPAAPAGSRDWRRPQFLSHILSGDCSPTPGISNSAPQLQGTPQALGLDS